MVLTGKQSLDFSGGVSAEDNFGIGGYDRVMGPNGQAQYWAPDLAGAFDVLMAHYEHTYVAPGETGPRRAATTDPSDRDVSSYPHDDRGQRLHARSGEIFSAEHQPGPQEGLRHPHGDARRRRPGPRRRSSAGPAWPTPTPRSSRTPTSAAIPVCLLGIESRAGRRDAASRPPTARTPTPPARCSRGRRRRRRGRSTRPAATGRSSCWRTCPASTGRRSRCATCSSSTAPRSAARSSTSDGPIVFCVISRYHGGAFVVFSKALNPQHDGARASRARSPRSSAARPPRPWCSPARSTSAPPPTRACSDLEARIAEATGSERSRLRRSSSPSCAPAVRAEKIGEVAAEFDGVHNIHRAVEVGSVDAVIAAARLRPEIIAAIER